MQGEFLVGAAVGSGLAASTAERGGADFLLAINAGRMRNMGSPSVAGILPIADATRTTNNFGKDEVLNRSSIPVLIGVNVMGESNDPVKIIDEVVQQGFDGVVNFPSCLHYTPSLQHILERGNRGIGREVEVLQEAKSRGLKTLFYCSNRTQARQGADADLDMILLNVGWNAGGAFGHTASTSLEEVAFKTLEIGRLIKRIRPGTRFLLEGGPIVTSEDLARVVELAELDGYVGGSTIDRLPLEGAVGNLIAGYRQAGRRKTKSGSRQQSLSQWGQKLGTAGSSSALLACLATLKRVAPLNKPVFLQHSPGSDITWAIKALEQAGNDTGTQVVRPGVEDIHGNASRRLFGTHRNGIYKAGALGDDPGDGKSSTIIIHAPERLSPRNQRRLVRALEENRYMAIGSRRWRPVTARCIFTSDSWTHSIAPEKTDPLLADFMQTHRLVIPSLKDRADDVPALMKQHIRHSDNASIHVELQPSALLHMQNHDWPANERELYEVLDRLILNLDDTARADVDINQIQLAFEQVRVNHTDIPVVAQSEKAKIIDALWRNNFHRSRTAASLGVSRKTLYNKILRYGLDQ